MTRALAISLPLFFLFAAIIPCSSRAQVSPITDVTVRNFPETQQVRGEVQVNNLPEVQKIKGSVEIEGTTKYIKQEDMVVPTSQRGELSEMVYAGTIEMDGFTSVLVSMQGEVRSAAFAAGSVGVLLIPDEKSFLRALRDTRRVLFPIETKAQIKSGDSVYFEADQIQRPIAFSRYRMYLYNTTNRSVETNVYLYLSNAPIAGSR